jgi:hypothetical protein
MVTSLRGSLLNFTLYLPVESSCTVNLESDVLTFTAGDGNASVTLTLTVEVTGEV